MVFNRLLFGYPETFDATVTWSEAFVKGGVPVKVKKYPVFKIGVDRAATLVTSILKTVV